MGAWRVPFSRKQLLRKARHRAHFSRMKTAAEFGPEHPKAEEDVSRRTAH